MAAPNRFDVVERVYDMLFRPDIRTVEGCERLTAAVAATLHFGSSSVGVAPDPRWGRRRNPTGPLAFDVLHYRDDETIDIVQGGGGPNARLQWTLSTPGVWEPPNSADVVGTPPPTDPGTPTDPNENPVVAEIRKLRGDVQRLASHLGA